MFLRTERLFLRPAWLEDAPQIARALGHEDVVRMLARVPWPYSEDHARAWIARPKDPNLPSLLVTLPIEQGRIVGGCGLHDVDGHVELGYWISPEYQGRGYATEAVKGLLSLARVAGHRQILARHAFDNPASGQVLHKAGFRPTGRSRQFHSLGRGRAIEGPEFAIALGECPAVPCGPMHRPRRRFAAAEVKRAAA
jgi:RimJ/RimL family protein N-acetyltransferase